MKIGILGGGISGLACAYFSRHDCTVLERESRVGGLCRTFEKEGFLYDQGGHIIFSKDEAVLAKELELLAGNHLRQFRRNVVWYKNRYVKYPFENGLAALDKEDLFECLYHYLKNDCPKPTNFAEWIYATFGKGIAECYLLPYNRKIWKTDPAEMSMGWVERVPKPPLEDVIKSAVGIETEGYLHQLHFHYPAKGGFESLVRAFAAQVPNIVTNFQVQSIRRAHGNWQVSSSSGTHTFDRLISTMPLEYLANCLGATPPDVAHAIDNLRYNTVLVAMIGINQEYLTGKSAIYIPDPGCLAHRLCFNTYFSPAMAPAGCSSLIAEITSRPGDELDRQPDEAILGQLVQWLGSEKFLNPDHIVAKDLVRVRHGYPVYDLAYERNVAIATEYFQAQGIELCGRFAEHLYINSDVCIRRAWDLAERLNSHP